MKLRELHLLAVDVARSYGYGAGVHREAVRAVALYVLRAELQAAENDVARIKAEIAGLEKAA